MTASEKKLLAFNLPNEDRAKRITTFWTLKEGCVKAIGEGIGFGLERIQVDMDDSGVVGAVSVNGRDVKELGWNWSCGNLEGYGWAAYWKGPNTKCEVQHISWETFMKPFETCYGV